MAFPDYSGVFNSGGVSFNPSAYSGSYNLGSKSSCSGMWPLALAGFGSSVISGIFQGQAANRQADAMLQSAAWQVQASRDAQFSNLLSGQYAQTGAKQFDRFQQQKAADYQQAFLDPRTSQLASEDRQRSLTDALSPKAQQLRRQQNIDQLNRDLASKRALTDAMFGRVAEAPFSYGNVPGYAAYG